MLIISLNTLRRCCPPGRMQPSLTHCIDGHRQKLMPMGVVVVAAVAALARVEGKQKRYRIAMFKESRTGST